MFEVQNLVSFLDAYPPPCGRKVVLQGTWAVKHSGHQLHHYRGCRDWWWTSSFQSGDTSAGRGYTPLWCYIMAVMSNSWMDSGQSCILESKQSIIPCMFKAVPSFWKNLTTITWRYQVLVGTAVRSEDVESAHWRHRAWLDHKLHRHQLTCMTEPHAWEELDLWVLNQNIEQSARRLNYWQIEISYQYSEIIDAASHKHHKVWSRTVWCTMKSFNQPPSSLKMSHWWDRLLKLALLVDGLPSRPVFYDSRTVWLENSLCTFTI